MIFFFAAARRLPVEGRGCETACGKEGSPAGALLSECSTSPTHTSCLRARALLLQEEAAVKCSFEFTAGNYRGLLQKAASFCMLRMPVHGHRAAAPLPAPDLAGCLANFPRMLI